MAFVFDTMGTTVSVTSRVRLGESLQSEVRGIFEALDARFSLYRPDSEASAIAGGALAVAVASAELRATHDLALRWSTATNGAFSPHRPDGVLDLAGVVKAIALQRAVDALLTGGVVDWCLNAGGDVLVHGANADGGPWTIGVVDPDDRQALLTQFTCSAELPAVATSGTSERGDHVWGRDRDRPGSTRRLSSGEFRQVTVAGPDIVTSDVLATAVLAGGRPSLEHVLATWPVEVIAAGIDGDYVATSRFRHVPGTPRRR